MSPNADENLVHEIGWTYESNGGKIHSNDIVTGIHFKMTRQFLKLWFLQYIRHFKLQSLTSIIHFDKILKFDPLKYYKNNTFRNCLVMLLKHPKIYLQNKFCYPYDVTIS